MLGLPDHTHALSLGLAAIQVFVAIEGLMSGQAAQNFGKASCVARLRVMQMSDRSKFYGFTVAYSCKNSSSNIGSNLSCLICIRNKDSLCGTCRQKMNILYVVHKRALHVQPETLGGPQESLTLVYVQERIPQKFTINITEMPSHMLNG